MTIYKWDGGFAAYEQYDGQPITVIRELNDSERDPEVGTMYLVTLDNLEDTELHVYADEVSS